MAISATNLTQFNSNTDANSYATASISPTTNRLIIATVTSSKSGTPDTPTLSGNGLTWVQFNQIAYDTVGTQRASTFFRAMGSSPTPGAVTADFGGVTQTACVIIIDEFSDVDTSGTNGSGAIVQSVTGTEYSLDTLTITLGSFSSANNATYGVVSNGDSGNYTAGTGFTQVGASGSTTPLINTMSQFRSDNDTSVTFAGTALWTMGGIAIEIKAAPISATNLTSFSSDTDATSYNTSSITPSSNNLVLITVTNVKSSTPDTPTVSGNGLTWVQIDTHVIDSLGTQRRQTLFRSMGSAPTTGAITIDFGGNTQTACTAVVDQFSGIDTSGTNGSGAIVQSVKTTQDNTGNTTSCTATLAAFSSTNNATYGAFGSSGVTGLAAGTGFTLLASASSTTPTSSANTEWKSTNDTTVDFTFDNNDGLGVIAVEIKAAITGVVVKTLAALGVG